ncbi:hypothetical protein D3C75_612480 [compost metagenome]
MLGAQVAVTQALHHRVGLHPAILHGDAGAAHQVAVAAFVEHFGQFAPEHGDGAAVAVIGGYAGAAQLQDRALQLQQAVQAEFFFAVEAAQAAGGLMVEQAGGGNQLAGAQVAYANVAAVHVVVVHVQALLGSFELGLEFGAEHFVAQGLGFLQGRGANQAFGLQTAFGAVVASVSDPSHYESP